MSKPDLPNPRLHEDTGLFREAVAYSAARTGFAAGLVEKDYFCTSWLTWRRWTARTSSRAAPAWPRSTAGSTDSVKTSTSPSPCRSALPVLTAATSSLR
jgi:hypothetical protein